MTDTVVDYRNDVVTFSELLLPQYSDETGDNALVECACQGHDLFEKKQYFTYGKQGGSSQNKRAYIPDF
jgi:hypothetical protein